MTNSYRPGSPEFLITERMEAAVTSGMEADRRVVFNTEESRSHWAKAKQFEAALAKLDPRYADKTKDAKTPSVVGPADVEAETP